MNVWRKILILIVSVLIFTNIFAVTANKPEKLTVVLDWFVNPDHAPLFVAQQQGYFKAQGLDVTIIPPADPSDPPKLVAAGKADIAIDYQPHLLLAQSEGLPLVQMGTLIATPLNCLAVLTDGPIQKLSDLKGKRIGYSVSAMDTPMLQTLLASQGLTLNDVTLINVRYDLMQALLSKKVDAVIGVMRNIEVIQMQLAGHPVRAYYPEDYGMPPYDELVFITRPGLKQDPRLQKFLFATEMGVQYLVNHPDSSWQQFAKEHPELNNELNQRAWQATLPRFALRPAAVEPARCQRLVAYLNKTLAKKIDAKVCVQ